LVLRFKPKNRDGDFETQIVAADFKAQIGKLSTTGFEAKPGETIPVVFSSNH
jgi:hypothetical protein